ncbi:MAG: hypothetical protein KGV44_10920 [Flavobacteriaceae bacterium]|nr:hypothetical protein [Flavobacteriaceae bacterium]
MVDFTFEEENGLLYCCIDIKQSLQPIFVYPNRLYERAGNMTQLLKGNEITFFIEKRFSERTGQFFHRPPMIETPSDADIPQKLNIPQENIPETAQEPIIPIKKEPDTTVWRYLLLYQNGSWAYQKKESKEKDIVHQIPIPNSSKKNFLVIAYDNGRVNVVAINDLLNPRRSNGRRRLRPENEIYATGWNTDAQIKNIFIAHPTDLLVFFSTTADGTEWCKIHHLGAISVHGLNAQGNVLINERLDDAEITSCYRLSLDYHHLISSLILKNHQTSGYLGYRLTAPNFKKSISVLSKILEVDVKKRI